MSQRRGESRPMRRPVPRLPSRTLVVLFVVLAAVLGACSGADSPAGGYGPGMMGGGGMMGSRQGAAGVAGAAIAPADADALGKDRPAGSEIDRAANSITFTGREVQLAILAAPADGPDETFRLAGLTNPTIVVPSGAQVTLRLINADEGMPHNWLLTSDQGPFPYMVMMSTPAERDAVTKTLAPATSKAMAATTISFRAPAAGRYTYLCSVPGHAEEGMYGTFLVAPAS